MSYIPKRVVKRDRRGVSRMPGLILLLLLALALAAWFMLFGLCHVEGKSMDPNLADGELLVYQRNVDIKRGDIIVVKQGNSLIVKRVIGLPMDTIEVTGDGAVLVNGQPANLENVYILGQTEARNMSGPVQLNEYQYFVLGDNRPVSKDSRSDGVGLIMMPDIAGVVKVSIHIH